MLTRDDLVWLLIGTTVGLALLVGMLEFARWSVSE